MRFHSPLASEITSRISCRGISFHWCRPACGLEGSCRGRSQQKVRLNLTVRCRETELDDENDRWHDYYKLHIASPSGQENIKSALRESSLSKEQKERYSELLIPKIFMPDSDIVEVFQQKSKKDQFSVHKMMRASLMKCESRAQMRELLKAELGITNAVSFDIFWSVALDPYLAHKKMKHAYFHEFNRAIPALENDLSEAGCIIVVDPAWARDLG